MKKTFIQILMTGLVCIAAAAKDAPNSQHDFSRLYKSKNYGQLIQAFEADRTNNWRRSDFAYYYALALVSTGKTKEGLQVCRTIKQRFPKTDAARLAESAIKLWSPAENAKSLPPAMTPGLGVIGIKFILRFGLLPSIDQVFPGTPAAQAGLQSGDLIEAVDGVSTKGLTKEQIYQHIAGPANSMVKVSITRDGAPMEKQMKRMGVDQLRTANPSAYQKYLKSI